MTARSTKREREAHARRAPGRHPHSIATLTPESFDREDDLSYFEPEVRYRMISEAAFHRYEDRGCEEGYDVDDWLAAEADVDHQLSDAVKPTDGSES